MPLPSLRSLLDTEFLKDLRNYALSSVVVAVIIGACVIVPPSFIPLTIVLLLIFGIPELG